MKPEKHEGSQFEQSVTDCNNLGNAAKMREALETISKCDISKEEDCYTLYRVCEAALSSTPRNCDIYDAESCRMAYHLHGDGLMTMQAFADWLFSPAEEGGAK